MGARRCNDAARIRSEPALPTPCSTNGVTNDLVLDYDDLVLHGTMVKLIPLSAPKC